MSDSDYSVKMKILIATTNRGKLAEFRTLLKETPISIVSLEDVATFEIPETGNTFAENAEEKARGYALQTGLTTIADDSGLEVDALNGEPGVRSARFAGENATDDENNQKLIAALKGVPINKRTARFVCAIAISSPDGKILNTTFGICEGIIHNAENGTNGFGYDSLFVPIGFNRTFGELGKDVKNNISHRSQAMTETIDFIQSN